jgi:hypothetical protein
MRLRVPELALVALLGSLLATVAAITPEQAAQLPPPANHVVNFSAEIKPIFEASCVNCHGHGREKGGLRLDSRETFLKGGDSGPAVLLGNSKDSLLISLVQGFDPDSTMPKKGTRLTPVQIGILRAWIDQGIKWDAGVEFGRSQPNNLKPRSVVVPPGSKDANPIDLFLQRYYYKNHLKPLPLVSDRVFARRAYLDVVGLLPPPKELSAFVADKHAKKRERLVQRLLSDDRNYVENWLTFWNDLLRNDYKGTGYIDGGRKQITTWLYSALLTNMPFDKFVAQLVNPSPGSEGFTKGIVWRGVVNASQTPEMQAAQNISQVFMGVNLKCASCHDSFVNELTLADAYGLAGIYADGPLEMVRCDKPQGKKADLKFIYPELGDIDPSADRQTRLKRLAEIITQHQDGRLTRTLVNRLWQKFMGRGLVEPVDDMEKTAWDLELLDWLAEDFANHDYDLRFLIQRVLSSRAYQLPAVNVDENNSATFVFHGPAVRRLSAEQFRDAMTAIAGVGYAAPTAEIIPSESEQRKFAIPIKLQWIWNDIEAAEKALPGHVYFRKSIHLRTLPTDATAAIICDNSFTLFVNGHQVGSGNEFKTAFLFDLRPWLRLGENLFAIDAVNHLPDNSPPTGTTNFPPETANPAGLLFYARIRHSEGGVEKTNDFASNAAWLISNGKQAGWQKPEFVETNWSPAIVIGEIGMLPWRASKDYISTRLAASYPGSTRASLVAADPLMVALGRPNREQIVTVRPSMATTLQALELTNGETLSDIIKRGAASLMADPLIEAAPLVRAIYSKALGRKPTAQELHSAQELVGQPAQPAGVEDLLWCITMLPEFQLIY